ncbi:MAG: RsiV family protein [Fimbriimonadaceae bacterium]|nr:DUF3298 domain-containing protein [Chthonomonadaceae bacterium]MCO5297384.1 RsiV family protein [Fimbriimonadaceae bacterium]
MNLALALLVGLVAAPQGPGYANPTTVKVKIPMVGKVAANVGLVQFATSAPLCDFAEQTVRDSELHLARLWVRESKEMMREVLQDRPKMEQYLSYEGDTALKYDSKQLLSVWAHAEYYSGGAHGMRNTRTYNFALAAGKPVRFGVKEAFLRDKASRVALQSLLVQRAGMLEGTMWIAEGQVKYLSDEQLDRFWVDQDALVWEFDPYELGPYSSGPYTLSIPRMDVQTHIRPDGPLGFWARQ